MAGFDDETSRWIDRTYQLPDIVEQRKVVREQLKLQPGETVVDIGAGPGLLALELADEVGADGHVHAIDESESMLALANARADKPNVSFRAGDAIDLPLDDQSCDAAVSTQVYEYVPDMPAALAEVRRVLKPAGRLLIIDTDWEAVVWNSSDDDRMRRVLKAWDGHLHDAYLPRKLPRLLREAGFVLSTLMIHPILNVGYDENTMSASLLPQIAAFVKARTDIASDEADAWQADLEGLGEDYFFSLNRYLFVARLAQ